MIFVENLNMTLRAMVGQDLSVHMTQNMGNIDMWLTPNQK